MLLELSLCRCIVCLTAMSLFAEENVFIVKYDFCSYKNQQQRWSHVKTVWYYFEEYFNNQPPTKSTTRVFFVGYLTTLSVSRILCWELVLVEEFRKIISISNTALKH